MLLVSNENDINLIFIIQKVRCILQQTVNW